MNIPHTVLKLCIVLIMLCTPCIANNATVVYVDSETGLKGQISGTVEQYNRDELVLLSSGGQIKTVKSANILEMKLSRPDSYKEALIRIQHSEFEQAISLLKKAYSETSDKWVRQEILAKQIELYVKIDDFSSAIEKYSLMMQQSADSAFYYTVPLVWTSMDTSIADNSAKQLINQKNFPFLSLLGASILLSTDKKTEAQRTLNILRQSDDPILATLAQMQIHRLSLTPVPISEIKKLDSQVESLPKSLQYGPRFVLAQLWSRSSAEKTIKSDKVALNYLQSAQNSKAPMELQARCLYSAGNTLLEMGDKNEAFRIFTKLIQKYPDSTWTDQAKRTVEGKL